MSKPVNKNKVDVSQCFLMFMATLGDCDRVAAALDLEPGQVKAMAESEGWAEKIRRVSLMSKSGKPGDFERATNRAINFVQTQVLREQVNRLLREVQAMTDDELLSRACVRTRDGGMQLSAKFLVDVAAAAEAAQRMSYMALGDTCSERAERDGTGPAGQSGNDLHAAIIASLSNPSADPGPVTQRLIEEANAEIQLRASVELPVEASEPAQ